VDAEDLAQVSDSLRRAVQGGDAAAVRRAVEEFGWHELLEDEAEAAVATLLTLQGELLLPVSFLDDVLLAASGLALPHGVRVVLPHVGSLEPTSSLEGSEIHLDGVVQATSGTGLLVPCRRGDQLVLVTCTAPEPLDATGTLDPASGWVAVKHDARVAEILLDGADAAEAWDRVSAAGRRALAHELVAIGAEMLRLTLEHVTTREQFGQTLGSFQAVKHKLADVRLWQEVAALSAEAAWEDGGVESAALAKAAACRFSRSAREHCQQLLGGMGFTWEHPFHTYLRRALTLEPLLGGAAAQHRLLGGALREKKVPRDLAGL
jgi:hypothetical protein